jgi:hypothetical protein
MTARISRQTLRLKVCRFCSKWNLTRHSFDGEARMRKFRFPKGTVWQRRRCWVCRCRALWQDHVRNTLSASFCTGNRNDINNENGLKLWRSLKLVLDIINAAYLERFPSGPPLEERNGALGGGNDWGSKNPPAPPLNWRCLEPVLPDLRKCMGKEPTRKSPNESVRSIVDRKAEDPFLTSSSDDEE